MRKMLKFDEGMYVEPEELSGGLALWWKEEMRVQIVTGGKNIIEFVVRIPS